MLLEIPEVIHGRRIEQIKAELKEYKLEAAYQIFSQFEEHVNNSLKRSALTALCLCSEDSPNFYKLQDFDSVRTISDLIDSFGQRYSKSATSILKKILLAEKTEKGDLILFSHVSMPNQVYKPIFNQSTLEKKEVLENMDRSRYHEPTDPEMSMRIPRRKKDLADIDDRLKSYSMVQDRSTFVGQFANRGQQNQPGYLQNYMQTVGILQPEGQDLSHHQSYQRILDFTSNQGNPGGLEQNTLRRQDYNLVTPEKRPNFSTFGSKPNIKPRFEPAIFDQTNGGV